MRGYRPNQAHSFALARRQSKCKARISDNIWLQIDQLLNEQWSPEQISGWLQSECDITISIEWIYQHVLTDKQAGESLK